MLSRRFTLKYFIYLCIFVITFTAYCGWKHWEYLQIDYSNLEEMLYQAIWQEADVETSRIMNKILSKSVDEKTFFGYSAIPGYQVITTHSWRIALGAEEGFACQDLLMIDKLWMKYSKGYFGFSTQAPIAELIYNSPENKTSKFPKTTQLFEELKDNLGWDLWNGISPNSDSRKFYLNGKTPEEAKGFLPSYLWVLRLKLVTSTRAPIFVVLRKFSKCQNSQINK